MTDASPEHHEPSAGPPESIAPMLTDADRRAANAEAKHAVAEHRADANQRTAEAAELANEELASRNEELERENRSLSMLNLVGISRRLDNLERARVTVPPAERVEHVEREEVVHERRTSRSNFRAGAASFVKWLFGVILILLVLGLVVLGFLYLFMPNFFTFTNPFSGAPAAPKDVAVGPPPSDAFYMPDTSSVSTANSPKKQEFLADCDAHNGQVYTAQEWNDRSGADLNPGQLHCHAGDSWSQDP